MKKISLFLVLVLFMFQSCESPGWKKVRKLKYTIKGNNSGFYYCNQYKIKESCIIFKGQYLAEGYSQEGNFKICGSYTIKDNIYYGENNFLD